MNKILLMTAIGIFAVLGAGSKAVVHASIIGNFGIGYQAGKNQALERWIFPKRFMS